MDEIKEVFGDTAEIVDEVSAIMQSGVYSTNDVISVYRNYKAAEMNIPR